ncbi:hypothetical protein E9998_09585 [Glycomyces paridis]|uniref:Uncharacterized protein n=1 Tax=Glycomyces paridis TaxID=2126555 RepID=A0A4S8PL25_9ACTN|nr:hypothetical protein E9998_09585 [Glycomyces paridis]
MKAPDEDIWLDQQISWNHRTPVGMEPPRAYEPWGDMTTLASSTLDRIDEILLSYGPRKTADILVFDEDDEMEM